MKRNRQPVWLRRQGEMRSRRDDLSGLRQQPWRRCLPTPSFIRFTGTPIGRPTHTPRRVRRLHSIYDIQRAVADRHRGADLLREPHSKLLPERRRVCLVLDAEFEKSPKAKSQTKQGKAEKPWARALEAGWRSSALALVAADLVAQCGETLRRWMARAMVRLHEPPAASASISTTLLIQLEARMGADTLKV